MAFGYQNTPEWHKLSKEVQDLLKNEKLAPKMVELMTYLREQNYQDILQSKKPSFMTMLKMMRDTELHQKIRGFKKALEEQGVAIPEASSGLFGGIKSFFTKK